MERNLYDVVDLEKEMVMVQTDNYLKKNQNLKNDLEKKIKIRKFREKNEWRILGYLCISFMVAMVTGVTTNNFGITVALSGILAIEAARIYPHVMSKLKTGRPLSNLNEEVLCEEEYLSLSEKLVDKGKISDMTDKYYLTDDLLVEVDIKKYEEGIVPKGFYLTKEETMYQLAYESGIYAKYYNLPKFTIRENEWNVFMDVMFDWFSEIGLEEKFYDYMSSLFRYALAKSLVDNLRKIDINLLITSISHFKKFSMSDEEIEYLCGELRKRLGSTNVININDYVDLRMSKK